VFGCSARRPAPNAHGAPKWRRRAMPGGKTNGEKDEAIGWGYRELRHSATNPGTLPYGWWKVMS